ncbi:hypothetical protein MED297_13482 [Reinekea sp. MED297]|uniref:Uncharacterized protein n=1 Tax=Reinekea blandensis MED297 TaxID=314283 RepID=A4BCH2_9GAMM|nr:hypothetical protein MED297_13482 [Reinekea sp. MED297] [Reinekea blandensis MED297]
MSIPMSADALINTVGRFSSIETFYQYSDQTNGLSDTEQEARCRLSYEQK